MEEQILIQSKPSKKTKIFFLCVAITLFIFSIIFFLIHLICLVNICEVGIGRKYVYICTFCEHTFSDWESTRSHVLKSHFFELWHPRYVYLAFISHIATLIILHWAFLLMSVMSLLTYFFLLPHCNLAISNNFIKARTFWGKKVELPIHMVSSYSTRKILSVVSISTSSGIIRIPGIGNYKEIDDVLKNLLTERQKKTEVQASTGTYQSNTKNLDDLITLKNLLDNGIITQEEFDLKKKEILNL